MPDFLDTLPLAGKYSETYHALVFLEHEIARALGTGDCVRILTPLSDETLKKVSEMRNVLPARYSLELSSEVEELNRMVKREEDNRLRHMIHAVFDSDSTLRTKGKATLVLVVKLKAYCTFHFYLIVIAALFLAATATIVTPLVWAYLH